MSRYVFHTALNRKTSQTKSNNETNKNPRLEGLCFYGFNDNVLFVLFI